MYLFGSEDYEAVRCKLSCCFFFLMSFTFNVSGLSEFTGQI